MSSKKFIYFTEEERFVHVDSITYFNIILDAEYDYETYKIMAGYHVGSCHHYSMVENAFASKKGARDFLEKKGLLL